MSTNPSITQAAIIIVAAFLIIIAIAFGVGRCTAPDPTEEVILDDPNGGFALAEYTARMNAAVHVEDERLARLEAEHVAEVEAMRAEDQAEYEAVRSQGRNALAAWFKARSRALLTDAGPR